MAPVAKSVRVTGRVQGVWFRGWTRQEAQALGLNGWVRNAADGSVEALFSGPEAAVAEMLERLQDGPRHARVARVEVQDAEPPEGASGFAVVR